MAELSSLATTDLGLNWAKRFESVRRLSETIAEPLSAEDCAIQTMPDVSPTRWHLAHTTWFFETFLLSNQPGFEAFDESFEYLFNSYYNSVGEQFPRHRRGTLSRPGLEQTLSYRQHVNQQVGERLAAENLSARELSILELGLHHEQQHQELMLTDIKHVLSCNPLFPAYDAEARRHVGRESAGLDWISGEAGITDIGHAPCEVFAFDNESPRHPALLHDYQLSSRTITNAEYLEFIEDGGYQEAAHWLSMGWATVQADQWKSPLYWVQRDGSWFEFTLSGLVPLDPHQPVTHISFFEADAFARWSGSRLPTEFEWEAMCRSTFATQGDFSQEVAAGVFADHLFDRGHTIQPQAEGQTLRMLGNTWEWTASQYTPYPGFSAADGALGEYNGKFMCNQFVLRGGSCATSSTHIRPTYRNFFPPDARWQFTGIRLAK